MSAIASLLSGESAEEESPSPSFPGVVRCPVCGGDRVHYSFSVGKVRVVQCTDCGFSFCAESRCMNPTNAAMALESVVRRYGSISHILNRVIEDLAISTSSVGLADWDMDGTVRITQFPGDAAQFLTEQSEHTQQRRVIVSVGQLEAFWNPIKSLTLLSSQLQKEDLLIFIFSDVQGLGAEMGTREWERLIDERAAYLDSQIALKVLFRAGFRIKAALRLGRGSSPSFWTAEKSHRSRRNAWKRRVSRLLPRRFVWLRPDIPESSDVAIVATPRELKLPLISVIVPVFDEAATVKTVIDSVLAMRFEGAQTEVIIVESNSKDGSREIVQSYADDPRVTCLFEDSPHGKGHAIRLGLGHARGDVLMIQDADLEYDFEDYHSLIEPVLRGRDAFILGSRHGGRNHFKLRRFTKPLLAKLYNTAHVLVTAYINLLFGLRLRDPQTMFKVFRRDCIEGINFRANYFNFDYELLLKIVRKGYKPREIPVNYRSRSHAEGKKIRMWRDAPLGLWTITKLRFTPLSSFLGFGERVE